jgi:hypothetical protein
MCTNIFPRRSPKIVNSFFCAHVSFICSSNTRTSLLTDGTPHMPDKPTSDLSMIESVLESIFFLNLSIIYYAYYIILNINTYFVLVIPGSSGHIF